MQLMTRTGYLASICVAGLIAANIAHAKDASQNFAVDNGGLRDCNHLIA